MRFRSISLTLYAAAVAVAPAQQTRPSTTIPPLRPLGAIVTVAPDSFKSIAGLRQLSDGRVLVNDVGGKRLLLFDSSLTRAVPVLDTSGRTSRRYPDTDGSTRLFAARGDSSLFLDGIAQAMVAVTPVGTVARVYAPPLAGFDLTEGGTGIDPSGRAYHEGNDTLSARPPKTRSPFADSLIAIPDTVALLRGDRDSRSPVVVAYLHRADQFPDREIVEADGFVHIAPTRNPLPVADQWTMLPDGTIAIVRAHDFHIDWLKPDGTREASPKLPHTWHRIGTEEKEALVDSVRQLAAAHPAIVRGRTRGADGTLVRYPTVAGVPNPDQLPDYASPLARAGLTGLWPLLADADGNVWILEPSDGSRTAAGIYALVNRAGEMFDRVQIPGGTFILGFGPGVAYLSSRTGPYQSLVRAKIR